MIEGDSYRSDDVEVVDIDEEGPVPVLDESGILALELNFGRGVSKKKMLVTQGITLTQLSKLGQDE